jgi:hypothetical protein
MPLNFGLRQIACAMQLSVADQSSGAPCNGCHFPPTLRRRVHDEMSGSEKNRLAALVIDQHCALQVALAERRKRYPTREFRAFAAMIRQYLDATGEDEMLHRNVVRAVHGLLEYLQSERKSVPNEVLVEAERLECLLFLGYDPHFDGGEPPGL